MGEWLRSSRCLNLLLVFFFVTNAIGNPVEIKWAWYDYLCLVCSLGYKDNQMNRVIKDGNFAAACDLQNGKTIQTECYCQGKPFDPFVNHCHYQNGVVPFNIKAFISSDRRAQMARRYSHVCVAKQAVGSRDFHYEFLIEPAAPQIELKIALTSRNQPPSSAREPERTLFKRVVPREEFSTDKTCTLFSTGTVDGGTLFTHPDAGRIISAIMVHKGCKGEQENSLNGHWVIEHFTWSVSIPESGRISNYQVAQCTPLR